LIALIKKKKIAFKISTGKLAGKGHIGRPWREWENNIKKDLKETGCEGVNRIQLTHDIKWWVVMNSVKNLLVPKTGSYFLTRQVTISF
jgi:hypothetical protein